MVRWSRLLLLPLLFGCAPRPNMPPGRLASGVQVSHAVFPPSVLPALNQEASGNIMFLNRPMILPEGRWRVSATQAVVNKTVGLVGGYMALLRIDGTVLRGVLIVSGNAVPARNGLPLSPICQTSDVIWNDVHQAVPQGEQDCAVVNFERPALWRSLPQSLLGGVMQQLDVLNIQPPNYMVYVMAHEANRNWILDETLLENPDAAGIPPDLSTQRALSGWTAFRLGSDPARQQFIEALKARAAPMRLALRRQIEVHAPFIPHSGLTPA